MLKSIQRAEMIHINVVYTECLSYSFVIYRYKMGIKEYS